MEPEIGKWYKNKVYKNTHIFRAENIEENITHGVAIFISPHTITIDDLDLYNYLFREKAYEEVDKRIMYDIIRKVMGNNYKVVIRNRKWGKID